ncbi:formylglycine-generating enzyme family protein [Sorangium sp. So ce1153]|uniref:formylglycine-generating enzyme family protein n=1 Tax=Sorangium sp. So ce1153 TaxID=3133333 RepID=UPI003F645045
MTPPSCVGLAATCGPEPEGDESCCASAEVESEGRRFNRDNDTRYPATVSGFLLDRFEVTVGRFRKFVEAYPASKPAEGAGRHPLIEGSGWNAAWTNENRLPAGKAELKAEVKCSSSYQTWTDDAAEHENLPMNCLSWYVAFAFCAWDGGRLATEAEWNYAAAGGDDQREYPWSAPASSTTIDGTYAVYDCMGDASMPRSCAFSDIQPVGSRSRRGDGKWRQADLAGNLWEWVLDWYEAYPNKCSNCANLTATSGRVLRGGGWGFSASALLSSGRSNNGPSNRGDFVGARCARTPQ